jgi:hypothetical protein
MTVRLNEAYDLAFQHLTERKFFPKHPLRESFQDSPGLDLQALADFQNYFTAARDEALQGIYLYYNFGLENVHRRSEGVFRQRFNKALLHLKKSIDSLNTLGTKTPAEKNRRHLVLYSTFFRIFRENMLINKTFTADGSLNHKAYRHYRNGSEILDEVLKSRLFPKDFKKIGINSKSLTVSEYEFMLVLTQFKTSIWIPETVIKLMLIDGFRKIEEFETGMTHRSHAR